ncbi:MAG: hypothetical protein GEU73_04945 [Chloroflexi bacterium]|nr:hypothetical protein [Chloroflexota bacterium]
MARKKPYTVGKWKGQPNYSCIVCPRADLDKDSLLRTMTDVCSREDCPGKPRVVTKPVSVPLLNAKEEPITERPMTEKEKAEARYFLGAAGFKEEEA